MPKDLRDQLQRALGAAYHLERELGQGGMATVFLAEDLKHQRKVAVKVLRPELAAALGADRFTREIRIAARLQHPHILPLLDSGESDGFLWYVMPYVDGQSLRDRLARQGELPVHEAVRLLIEVTDALAFAHAQGVVHRDIKPDNVLLSGRHALVMDFGVAKAVGEATGRQTLTTAGLAIGTPAYMAPEQATADPNLDHRVDIYAVGVMAYELLTGRTPFHGLSPQQVLAAHVTEQPAPMTRYRPSLPPALQSVVMKCLAKHPADRWQSAQELLTQLEPLMTPSGGTTPVQTRPVTAVTPPVGPGGLWPKVALGVTVLVLVTGAVLLARRRPAEPLLGRRTQVTLDPGLELDPALSPDGKLIAYSAGPSGIGKIFVRQLDGGGTIALTASVKGDLRRPQWTPDGSRIAFQSPRGIEIVPALGGAPKLLVAAPGDTAADLAWSPDGRFVVYRMADSLYVRAADGGAPRKLVGGHEVFSPSWSPDGRWLAYSAFVQGSNVWALTIPAGPPVSAARARPVTTGNQIVESFDVSRDGQWLAYDSDRTGNQDIFRMPLAGGEPEQLTTDPADDFQPKFSPDGREIAFHTFRSGTRDLFVMSAGGGEQRPVVATAAQERDPGWSPDGRRMSYASDATGRFEVYTIPRAGEAWGTPRQVTHTGGIFPFWSPDGRFIIYDFAGVVWLVPADGGEVTPLPMRGPLEGRASDAFAATWAPDSRHVFTVVSSDTAPFQTMWSVPIDGGPPRPLILFDDPLVTFGRGVFTARDSTIYFALLRSESDVWVVEVGAR